MAMMKVNNMLMGMEKPKRPKDMEENEIYEDGYCYSRKSRKFNLVGQSEDPRAVASRKQIEDEETILPYS